MNTGKVQSLGKSAVTGCGFQRALHHVQSLQHHLLDGAGSLVWQEIRDPDESTRRHALRENLKRCVVVSEWLAARGPSVSACLVVNGDDELTNGHPVCECDEAGATFEFAVDHEPRD